MASDPEPRGDFDAETAGIPGEARTPLAVQSIHEAGHAVAYVVTGIGCLDVSVGEAEHPLGDSCLGLTRTEATPDPLSNPGEAAAMPFLVAIFAGGEAVRRLLGEHVEPGDAVDRDHAALVAAPYLREIAEPGGPSKWKPLDQGRQDALLSTARARAGSLVTLYRRAILATAERLLGSGRLTGEEVEAIIAANPPEIEPDGNPING